MHDQAQLWLAHLTIIKIVALSYHLMKGQSQQPDERPDLWIYRRAPTYWTHYQSTQWEAKTPSSPLFSLFKDLII